MLTRTQRIFASSGPRYRWMVVAAAAVLISVLAGWKSGSAATTYDSEELQFLRLINTYWQ